jgi:hypothetical protein
MLYAMLHAVFCEVGQLFCGIHLFPNASRHALHERPKYLGNNAMLSAILMMHLFLNDFLSPYLPIPSSPHLFVLMKWANFFMDDRAFSYDHWARSA